MIAFALVALAAFAQEPLKDVRDGDPTVRARAAEALASDASSRAEAALVKVVRSDDDLLVRLAGIGALAGRDSKAASKALAEVALESLFRVERARAAAALARTQPEVGRESLTKELSGRTALLAAESLAAFETALGTEVGPEVRAKSAQKAVKMLRAKDARERAAGAHLAVILLRGAGEERAELLEETVVELLGERAETEVVAAVLEGLAAAPDPADAALLDRLAKTESLTSVIERRLESALAAHLESQGDGPRLAAVVALGGAAAPRVARAIALAGALPANVRVDALVKLLGLESEDARAAAAHALGALGDDGLAAARAALAKESSSRVLVQLVETVAPSVNTKDGGAALLAAAAEGPDPRVRDALALALGTPDAPEGAVDVLAGWTREGPVGARVVAAVALGKTRAEAALAPLAALLASEEWQLRGAGVVGLQEYSGQGAVAPLIERLADPSPTVALSAHRALLALSGREGEEVDRATWAAWWKENLARVDFRTRAEKQALSEKYGYGVDDRAIYAGLDVIVIPGRGDRIEAVLERLGIVFRTVAAGSVAKAGLHPGAVLLVGCTGEISPSDAEVVRWYVQTGGALFTSCWALSYTVEPAFPAVLSRFPSPGEVLDNVFAVPTSSAKASPYLTGVFEGGVQPFYSLVGAHLVHVADPERAEVLLDSPAAAARHGSGDLAAWFRAGHGVVLDTANHFEEQGFASAPGLDGPDERQAFAVNHLGLSALRLRETQGENWWRSQSKTAAEVADLSVFRILTNFVREKRIGR